MKMNEKGLDLYKKWEDNYYQENDRLGGNSAEGDFVEGWCIIDNLDYLKTMEDVCGLLLFGYDDSAPCTVSEWIERCGDDFYLPNQYKYSEILAELAKYYD